MTPDNFCFYLRNRLIQTSQTGGQRYSDTSPFSIPWFNHSLNHDLAFQLLIRQGIFGIKFSTFLGKLGRLVFVNIFYEYSKMV